MFSQWRQAVESLAQTTQVHPQHSQHSPKPSEDASVARSSTDSVRQATPSASLADATIQNLRKTFIGQHPANPAGTGQPRASASEQPAGRSPGHRSTLEDRLRAKFAIGDASSSTTPNTSSNPSRATTPVVDHSLSPTPSPQQESSESKIPFRRPLSPTFIPLPDSPVLMPVEDTSEYLLLERAPSPLSISAVVPLAADASAYSEESMQVPNSEVLPSTAEEITDVNGMFADDQVQADDQDRMPTMETEEALEERRVHPFSVLQRTLLSIEDIETHEPVKEPSQPIASANGVDGNDLQSAHDAAPNDIPGSLEFVVRSVGVVLSDEQQDSHPDVAVTEMAVRTSQFISPAPSSPPLKLEESNVDALQSRLRLVEQRFTDVSTSFKRLQAEKVAADRILLELTPLKGIHDADALNDYFQNMNFKIEMAQDEIKRLTGKLSRQDERIEELRDTHRLESKSQSDQIERLRAQVDESEALLKASQIAHAEVVEDSNKKKAEIDLLLVEVDKARGSGKEEEEKRVKAIALLKTVRQKLVKAEKEKDDVSKELQSFRERCRDEMEKDRQEKQKLLAEIEAVNRERETAISGLKVQFDKDISVLKERFEKEQLALRGQHELEAVTSKAVYTKEAEGKTSRIFQLENTVQTLRTDKDELFDQLQMRQAELESSRHLLETLQSQSNEFQYQIRESTERVVLLQEELVEAQRVHASGSQTLGTPADEVSRLLRGVEAKYESRLAETRRQLTAVERERDEGEAEWNRKLNERVKEIDALRRATTQFAKSEDDEQEQTDSLKEQINRLQEELRLSHVVVSDLKGQAGKIAEVESAARSQLASANATSDALRQQLEVVKTRDSQLRANNKTLRDELRKVQSSAALLERQRNPGVGYWAARPESSSEVRSPRSSTSDLPSQNGQTSRPESPTLVKSDEDVNFEYLRNVILQFLEHKEMRPHLVRILATILHFTPQETRRLVSKV